MMIREEEERIGLRKQQNRAQGVYNNGKEKDFWEK